MTLAPPRTHRHTPRPTRGPAKSTASLSPWGPLKSQGVEGTSEGKWAKRLPHRYPGRAGRGRRQPPRLTHPGPDTYPQLFNLGKSQTAQVTGRDCQRSFSPSCTLLFTWPPQVVCWPTHILNSPCPPMPGQVAFQTPQVGCSKLRSLAPDPARASGLARRLSGCGALSPPPSELLRGLSSYPEHTPRPAPGHSRPALWLPCLRSLATPPGI